MKTGFKDPIEPKSMPRQSPKDGKNSPWTFTCPPYDERSSCFVNAGDKWGVGHRTPVGRFSATSPSPIPKGRVATLESDEVA